MDTRIIHDLRTYSYLYNIGLKRESATGDPNVTGENFFLPFYCFKWKVLLDYVQIQNIKSLRFTYEKREKKQLWGGIFYP